MRATRTVSSLRSRLLSGRGFRRSRSRQPRTFTRPLNTTAPAMLDALKLMEHPREEEQAIESHLRCAWSPPARKPMHAASRGARHEGPLYRPSSDSPAAARPFDCTARPARRCCRPLRSLRIRRRRRPSTSRTTAPRLRGFALVLQVLSYSGRRGGCQQVTAG